MLEKKDGLFCFFIEHNNTWQDKATGLKCNKKYVCVNKKWTTLSQEICGKIKQFLVIWGINVLKREKKEICLYQIYKDVLKRKSSIIFTPCIVDTFPANIWNK